VVFGLIGYGMMIMGFEPAPLLLGYILGPLMEEHLRRALLLSRGDMSVFLTRPISAGFLTATFLLLAFVTWSAIRRRGRPSPAFAPGS
jgi:TctA family transporter